MKFNTLLVPAIAFATLAVALPSDASVESDQGKYKPRPKATTPQKEENAVENIAAKLPVQAPVDKLPVGANSLPVKTSLKGSPVNGIPPSTDGLPVQPPVGANGLPVQPPIGAGSLPVDAVSGLEGVLSKLPVQLPPKVPHMRRSRHHAIREATTEEKTLTCGHLRIETGSSKYSGFLSASRDQNGRYTVVKSADKGTTVDLKGHNLIFRHEDMYPALGATYGVARDGNAGQDNIQGNSANFAMLTGTSTTLYGKPATSGQSSFNEATGAPQHIESAIYYFGENREIHASWVNKDGASIPTEFGVNPDGQVIISANAGQYAAHFGGYAARVFCTGQ